MYLCACLQSYVKIIFKENYKLLKNTRCGITQQLCKINQFWKLKVEINHKKNIEEFSSCFLLVSLDSVFLFLDYKIYNSCLKDLNSQWFLKYLDHFKPQKHKYLFLGQCCVIEDEILYIARWLWLMYLPGFMLYGSTRINSKSTLLRLQFSLE